MDLSNLSDEAKAVATGIAQDDVTCADCEICEMYEGCCWERVLADASAPDFCARMAAIVDRALAEKNSEIEALNDIITAKFEGSLPARFKLDVSKKTLVCVFPTVPEDDAAFVAAELSKAFARHVEVALKDHSANELREYASMIAAAYSEGWDAGSSDEVFVSFTDEWIRSKASKHSAALNERAAEEATLE